MSFKRFVAMHQDEIVTGVAIAGVGATVACTAKAVRNIDDMWDTDYSGWCEKIGCQEKDIRNRAEYEVSKAKVCWKEYLRVAIPVSVTVGSIVLMYRNKKTAAAVLSASLSACQAAYDNLEAGAKESLGNKKFDELKANILGKKADRKADERKALMENPPEPVEGEPLQTLIYDSCSDRYFYGDIEKIRRTAIKFNAELSSHETNWVTYTEFMEANGYQGMPLGDDVGWTYDPLDPAESLINVDIVSDIKDDEPYIIMNLTPKPLPSYFSI